MISGQQIVCFSNDWRQDPLSKHHIMKRLSQRNKILWINSIGLRTPTVSVRDASRALKKLAGFFKGAEKISENLTVISPIAIPFHGNYACNLLNNVLLRLQILYYVKKYRFNRPIFWTFLPNTADFIGMLREKLSVYYITDDFTQFKGHPSAAIEKAEKKLIGKCDLIIASARSLAEKKQQPGKPVSVVSHGVNHAHFAEAMTLLHKDLPADIRDLPRPILGFYGELNSWIDLPMIARAAQKRPAWSFALIGRVAVEAGNIEYLKKIPNIHLLGQKQYGELPAYCAAFNAALIPMVVNELTQHVNPLKLREYLAAGVPVISTPLPEVKPYADVVSFAVTADELIAAFEAVRRTPEKGRSARLSKRVEPEGWDGKVEEISALIGKAIGAA